MSKTECGQCCQDITGIDHRGKCPGVPILWRRVIHQGKFGGKNRNESKVHAVNLTSRIGQHYVAMCGFEMVTRHANDRVVEGYPGFTTCAICLLHVGLLIQSNKNQPQAPVQDNQGTLSLNTLVDALHQNGLSQLGYLLEIWLRQSTLQQRSSLRKSMELYLFKER